MQASPATTATAPKAPGATLCPDHALDQLRAAQLRRQLAGDRSAIFVHAARPGMVSDMLPGHNLFGGARFGTVSREQSADVADVMFVSTRLRMAPADLRAHAALLIDAAHDIETHPATLDTAGEAA